VPNGADRFRKVQNLTYLFFALALLDPPFFKKKGLLRTSGGIPPAREKVKSFLIIFVRALFFEKKGSKESPFPAVFSRARAREPRSRT